MIAALKSAVAAAVVLLLSGCATPFVRDVGSRGADAPDSPLVRLGLMNDDARQMEVSVVALDTEAEGKMDQYTGVLPPGAVRWVDLRGGNFKLSLLPGEPGRQAELRRHVTFSTKGARVVQISLGAAWEQGT